MDRTHFRKVIAEKSDLELIEPYFMREEYNPLFVEELCAAIETRPDLKEAIAHAESFADRSATERIAEAAGFYESKHPQPPLRSYEEEQLRKIIEASPEKDFLPASEHPVLGTFNGCGAWFVGKYNCDGNTYDTTRWLTFLWLPLVPVDAYRVTRTANSMFESEFLFHKKIKKDAGQVAKGFLPLICILLVVLALLLQASF